MRKINSIHILLVAALSSCGVSGVKEIPGEKNTTHAKSKDTTVKKEILAEEEIDSIPVNFDTAFNFTKTRPVDSVTLKSGVRLTYLIHGNGEKINRYNVVAINYRGTLTKGKLIESNETFKKPLPFVVGVKMTFEAFDEVLEQCHIGDKIRFVIPSEKAYGKKGRGAIIPPNSDLVYEMDILEKVSGQKTKSGVEYFSLIKNPRGSKPVEGDKITLAYMGWVKKTGKLFDASAASGKYYEFVLGTGVAIKAWHEVVAQMRKGEKVLVIAPAATCYGSKGVPELVPPNSDIIYLLEVKDVIAPL